MNALQDLATTLYRELNGLDGDIIDRRGAVAIAEQIDVLVKQRITEKLPAALIARLEMSDKSLS